MPDAIIHNLMQVVSLVAPAGESPARPAEGK
jgi:hypothetical protein